MEKKILHGGITLITEKRESNSIAIAVGVRVGSNNEPKNMHGVSHFLEHMLFEGTKKRPNATIISNEVKSRGGEFNAYTSNERTVFYIKMLPKHFDIALDTISDMLLNSTFNPKFIEKEKKVILKEINMVIDEPRFHQWILFQRSVFKNHPAGNPTYGTIKSVKSITRKDMVSYYRRHYVSGNLVLAVVGNLPDTDTIARKVNEKFSGTRNVDTPKQVILYKEIQNKQRIKVERRKILNAYMVMGYSTPIREESDSYVLDVIKALLARGQSGRIVEEIRIKKGLAYEINLQHDSNKGFGLFAVYLNSDKKNIPLIKKMILKEFIELKNVTDKEINISKGFIEGHYIMEQEDNFRLADNFIFWEHIKDVQLHYSYIDTIMKVTKKDIIRVAKEYINKNYTMALIE